MDGIRSSKNIGGDIHSYITQNGKVIRDSLSSPDACYTLDFIYDNAGKPFAMIYTNSGGTKTTYYYVLNALGDVVSLINSSGTVYASYTYDAWGKVLTSSGTMASTNPLRYRGYYYDVETGWYYLQSRYYDPVVKRFLNADDYASTGQSFLGYNLFTYCNNSPIGLSDHTGLSPMGPLSLADYWIIHKIVQLTYVEIFGWKMEVRVKGPRKNKKTGKIESRIGYLDLYDSSTSKYYEVKSSGAAKRASTSEQMDFYDTSRVASTGRSVSRNTYPISGNFKYGIWDVEFHSDTSVEGLIVYSCSLNTERAVDAGLFVLGTALIASGVGAEFGIPAVVYALA